MTGIWILAAIQLTGIAGDGIRARARFDANNVQVGDPMTLSVEFVGQVDFTKLTPPPLAGEVNGDDWKIDDDGSKNASTRYELSRGLGRLEYRVRPMREGVLWFPALDFDYPSADGTVKTVRSNRIPVHARPGNPVEVVPELVEEPVEETPKLDLVKDPGCFLAGDAAVKLDDDVVFAWRKALASPSADAFAAFDFPAAKLNEASCAVDEGDWSRALAIYRRLEWRIGQTPEIEKGMVAALALKEGNVAAELPVWRQILRPVLRYAWKGRLGLVVGGLAALVLLFYLALKGVRALAVVALVAIPAFVAFGETTETVTTNADGSVVRRVVTQNGGMRQESVEIIGGTGGAGRQVFSFGGGAGGVSISSSVDDEFDEIMRSHREMMEMMSPFARRRRVERRPPPAIGVGVASDKEEVGVFENFNLVVSVEVPRYVSLTSLSLALDEAQNFDQTGTRYELRSAESANPTNIIRRFAYPLRAKRPLEGPIHYAVEGAYLFAGEDSFFSSPHAWSSGARTAALTVMPLPDEGRPEGFGGVVASAAGITETCDLRTVGTNDIVTITYSLRVNGYVPDDYLPDEVAFEEERATKAGVMKDEIRYVRYFVADGTPKTPVFSIPFYDPESKRYKVVKTGGTTLGYHP